MNAREDLFAHVKADDIAVLGRSFVEDAVLQDSIALEASLTQDMVLTHTMFASQWCLHPGRVRIVRWGMWPLQAL